MVTPPLKVFAFAPVEPGNKQLLPLWPESLLEVLRLLEVSLSVEVELDEVTLTPVTSSRFAAALAPVGFSKLVCVESPPSQGPVSIPSPSTRKPASDEQPPKATKMQSAPQRDSCLSPDRSLNLVPTNMAASYRSGDEQQDLFDRSTPNGYAPCERDVASPATGGPS